MVCVFGTLDGEGYEALPAAALEISADAAMLSMSSCLFNIYPLSNRLFVLKVILPSFNFVKSVDSCK